MTIFSISRTEKAGWSGMAIYRMQMALVWFEEKE